MKRLVLAAALLLAAPAMAGVAEGNAAWEAGDYNRAIAEWRPAADAGSPEAQFNLGQAYKLGRGVTMNLKEAQGWYVKSAQAGFPEAQDMLGLLLFRQGDRAAAIPWIEKSAARGEPRALYVLGTAKFNGDYAPKDWPGAYAMMLRASESGLAQARTSLTQMDKFLTPADKQAAQAIAARIPAAAPGQQPPPQQLAQAAPMPTPMPRPLPAPMPQTAPQPVPVNPAPTRGTPRYTPINPAAQPAPPPVQVAQAAPVEGPTVQVDGQTVAVPGAEVNVPYTPPAATPAPIGRVPVPASAAPMPQQAVVPLPAPAVQAPVRTARAAPPPAPAIRTGGGWRVQLGAYATPGAARESWQKLTARVPALRAATYFTQPYGALTRLQGANLASKADAQRLCGAVTATGNGCFPVAP